MYVSNSLFLTYLFSGALGLLCRTWAFSRCAGQGLLSTCDARATHSSGFSCCRNWLLSLWASVAVGRGLSCPTACLIFPDQGSNLCPLHWQVYS